MSKKHYIHDKAVMGLWRLLKNRRLLFFGAILCGAVAVACRTIEGLVLREYIDGAISSSDWTDKLIYFSLAFVVIALISGGFSFLSARGIARTAETISRELRNDMYDHIQRLTFQYHSQMKTGELIQRVTSDIETLSMFFGVQMADISRIVLMFVVNFSVILFLDWKLALLSIVVVPFILFMSFLFFNRIHKAFEKYQDQDAKVQGVLQENLSGVRIVKAFARQEFEEEKFREESEAKLRLGKKFTWAHALYWPISHLFCSAQLIAGILIGGLFTIRGDLSIGTYLAYTGWVGMLIWPMQHLGRTIAQLSQSAVSYERITKVLREEQEDLDVGMNGDTVINGRIEIRDLNFKYDEEVPVLRNINFTCKKGQTVALLGTTGSGKTTLMNLIPRFYDYTDGEILLDGKSLNEYSRHFLRKNIGIVEQEPFLFSASIRENIAYGANREVTQEEIEAAAKTAAVHESIKGFPKGYDTVVGEKGVTLSGGQKQRLTLARTLLKDPKILILDDATASVDAETEDEIRKALKKLMKNRTTFVIAHKVQSVMNADQILVFHKGEIIQRGTHETLVKEEGFYRNVYQLQTNTGDPEMKEAAYV